MNEEWKPIEGHNGNYLVSNLGRVRNSNTSRILKQSVNRGGYSTIQLRLNKKRKDYRTHRLVALNFCQGYGLDNRFQVDHIDGNKNNNCYTNLRFLTNQENQWSKLPINTKKTSKYRGVHMVIGKGWSASITKDYKPYFLGYYESETEAAKAYNKRATYLFGEFARLNIVE